MKKAPQCINQRRQLISEAKLRVRGIGKEIADLKRELSCLEQFIENEEYVSAVNKSNKQKELAEKIQAGRKKRKILKLKAAMGGVREI